MKIRSEFQTLHEKKVFVCKNTMFKKHTYFLFALNDLTIEILIP